MKPITITIDLLKIDKSRIQERSYQNKDGVTVTEKNYSIDVVPLKEQKILKEGDTWQLVKTHFAKDSPTKEERSNKVNTKILGNGIMMQDKASTTAYPEEEINPTDVPF